MSNIVTEVANSVGGMKALAKMQGVKIQTAYLWANKGFFPLHEMPDILDKFPHITEKQLIDAYRDYCKHKNHGKSQKKKGNYEANINAND